MIENTYQLIERFYSPIGLDQFLLQLAQSNLFSSEKHILSK